MTEDVGVIEPQAVRVKRLVQEMTTLSRIIADYEKQIEKLIKTVDADNVFVSSQAQANAWRRVWPSFLAMIVTALKAALKCRCSPARHGHPESGKKKIVTMRWAARPSSDRAWSNTHELVTLFGLGARLL